MSRTFIILITATFVFAACLVSCQRRETRDVSQELSDEVFVGVNIPVETEADSEETKISLDEAANRPEDEEEESEFSREPVFNISDMYGVWKRVAGACEYPKGGTITINSDNTVETGLENTVTYMGVIVKTQAYEIRVRNHYAQAQGEEIDLEEKDREFVFIYDPVTNMLSGHSKRLFFAYGWFNDDASGMNILYSVLPDRNGISLDYLIFCYEKQEQILSLHDLEKPLHFIDFGREDRERDEWEFTYRNISFNDFNSDGYMDISVFSALRSDAINRFYEVFLYNPQTRAFYHNRELSRIPILLDETTQTENDVVTQTENADSQEDFGTDGKLPTGWDRPMF